jgi:hypothetical protein
MSITSRVAAGAAYLDAHEPGWLDRIDLGELDIGNGSTCMMGQLKGHFRNYAYPPELQVASKDKECVRLGFMWSNKHGLLAGLREVLEVRRLTKAWRRLILRRRRRALFLGIVHQLRNWRSYSETPAPAGVLFFA